MIFKDYYKILGLESNKATPEEIKAAYREQAKKYHPDINSENNFSEERFKDINEAYKVLSNPTTKRKYDRMWNSNIGKKKKFEESKREEGSIFSNFFNMFFGEQLQSKEEKKSKKKEKGPNKLVTKTKETWSELKKVSWPSFKTVCKNTGIVISVVIIFTLVLFGIDRLLSFLYTLIPG